MAKKLPEWFDKAYPSWKVDAWDAFRTFVSSFLGTFGLLISVISIDTFESKEILIKFIISVMVGSLSAGVKALGKYLRKRFFESTLMQKIPI